MKDQQFEPECLDTAKGKKPKFWISKWLYDKHSQFGIMYQLSDESIGFLFSDGTKIINFPNDE